MTNMPNKRPIHEDGLLSIKTKEIEVTIKIPLETFEKAWLFLDDVGQQDYQPSIYDISEDDFRARLALYYHLCENGFMDNSGYKLVLERAYYGGTWETNDDSFVWQHLEATRKKRKKEADELQAYMKKAHSEFDE